LATGVLIICTGSFTKQINKFQEMEKEYTGTFVLGATTPGFDMEKPIDQYYEYKHITHEMALQAAQALTGSIAQVPPLFSAIKIEGKRAFSYAREGETVEMKTRQVEIKEFELTRFSLPEIDFRIICSKGTYIRSIARDFGLALHSGAYLKSLRRTRIGDFRVKDAISIENSCL
jgi:tRNA pseudouridine55 synthase